MAEFFGFKIERKKDVRKSDAFTLPTSVDGAIDVAGGFYSQYLDTGAKSTTENELIRRYRDISQQPECDSAIEDIVNEAIVADEDQDPISISIEKILYSNKLKTKIREEFDEILRLLDFNVKGHDIFRRWYIDGRIFFHKVIDVENPRGGIIELRYLDPRNIKKYREVKDSKNTPQLMPTSSTNVQEREYEEFYVYSESGFVSQGSQTGASSSSGIKITADSICFCPSGYIDQNKGTVLSYLHKAIKPVNQLRMIEDSVVIYRVTRAPERRIFYIDVGNLPKPKAEQYLKDTMNRYRNKIVYDASTGELRDDRNHMSMLEDFWLPRREGGRGTEISTLPGGQNLGEIDDIRYFQKKLYRSLNVPVSRLEAETQFSIGRSNEITRDELKFTKFVQRIRKRFTEMFNDLLRTQLVLKGIINEEDWAYIKEHVKYDYAHDGYFTELKNVELLKERIEILSSIESYSGQYFSKEWIKRNVLKFNDQEIETIERQIKKEEQEGDDDNEDEDEEESRPSPVQFSNTGGNRDDDAPIGGNDKGEDEE